MKTLNQTSTDPPVFAVPSTNERRMLPSPNVYWHGVDTARIVHDDEYPWRIDLTTARLHLTTIRKADELAIFELFKDPAIQVALGTAQSKSEWVDRHFFKWLTAAREGNPLSPLIIETLGERAFVGLLVLQAGFQSGSAQVSIAIDPKHWYRGYGTAAISALISTLAPMIFIQGHRWAGIPLRELWAKPPPNNFAAIRVLVKAGFKLSDAFDLPSGREELYTYRLER